jgi:hypothetical protein
MILRDEALTADRGEHKFLVAPGHEGPLARAIGERLVPHRFTGEGANRLPGAHHYVTTVYFDSPQRAIFRTSIAGGESIKVRAKEYYDVHPSLSEVATDPRQLVRYRPVLWLEIKHRDGDRTRKQRLPIPKVDVAAFLGSGRITGEMLSLQADHADADADAEHVLAGVAALCREVGGLQAGCLVNYRRLAWQDAESNVRVTLDVQLAFFEPPADLWSRRTALVRESLGPPCGAERGCVVEVKWRGERPTWIDPLLERASAQRVQYSKFEAASLAVHGDAQPDA